MAAASVITLTTDFGHKGPFTAVMKGVIFARCPDVHVIDLMHEIPPQWPPEAGFWVSRAYPYFPSGSIHVAIVDPGVGSKRDILLFEHDGHTFIAPDNGLLGKLLEQTDPASVYKLAADKLTALGIGTPSMTFHGRDIFAPVAAELAAGRVAITDVAVPSSDWTPGWLDEPELDAGRVSGIVVTFDSFGNLISNIDATLLPEPENAIVHIAGHELPLLGTYSHAKPGDYLALINSFGVVEVARAEGNAAAGLGAERGAPIIVTRQ